MFLVGLILVIIGLLKQTKWNRITKAGVIIGGIPAGLFLVVMFYYLFLAIVETKPSDKDLIGVYHITETTNIDFDKSTFNEYKLVLRQDSTFTLTPISSIQVCDSGKYELDYRYDYNELTLRCPSYITTAHVDRRIGSFRIEFVIGDPDSGESIYFGKD